MVVSAGDMFALLTDQFCKYSTIAVFETSIPSILAEYKTSPTLRLCARINPSGTFDLITVSAPTDFGVKPNGVKPNGVNPNGVNPNGVNPNGVNPNGLKLNGVVVTEPDWLLYSEYPLAF